jgi:hypothetical protein
MDDLRIFRIFLAFPLIGLVIPDLGLAAFTPKTNIPIGHLIIEGTLLLAIFICSVGIKYLRWKKNLAEKNKEILPVAA